jgi:hypothetical protein
MAAIKAFAQGSSMVTAVNNITPEELRELVLAAERAALKRYGTLYGQAENQLGKSVLLDGEGGEDGK